MTQVPRRLVTTAVLRHVKAEGCHSKEAIAQMHRTHTLTAEATAAGHAKTLLSIENKLHNILTLSSKAAVRAAHRDRIADEETQKQEKDDLIVRRALQALVGIQLMIGASVVLS